MNKKEKTTLILGAVPDIHLAILHIAKEANIFSKYYLNLTMKEFLGVTGELAKALGEEAQIDIGIGLTDGLITAISKGADFKIVGTFVESPMKWVIVVAAAAANSKLTTIADLKGKVFGITKFGGGARINTILIAKKQGLSEENGDSIIRLLGDLNSMIVALKNGDIDCFV
jgi:ABC-type nitrate/sulfonate/bicarbonate transport system substrate-binding protein